MSFVDFGFDLENDGVARFQRMPKMTFTEFTELPDSNMNKLLEYTKPAYKYNA